MQHKEYTLTEDRKAGGQAIFGALCARKKLFPHHLWERGRVRGNNNYYLTKQQQNECCLSGNEIADLVRNDVNLASSLVSG